jgi:1-deoxy-D-xylulose-5-phosphate reductoisomerase
MKKVIILGSTGSLGTQTIEVLKKHPSYFKLIGISAHKNEKLLKSQRKKFKIPSKYTVLTSRDNPKKLLELCQLPEVDIVVNVLSGISGIKPTVTALKTKKIVLLGNKESLIAEGEKIMQLTKRPASLIPLDSEHNAIYEILKKHPKKIIKKIILPCSGGPFLHKSKSQLRTLTAAQALAHPRWNMGPKISIESATLINKGLEIIEAHYLFTLPLSKIQIRIHPECRIHGIVEFKNHPQPIAYISKPDMREHIENALLRAINKTPPKRQIRPLKPNEFPLTPPDHKTFPGIKIVTNAFRAHPHQMRKFLQKEENIINQFLRGKIKFLDIFKALQS